MPKTHITIPIFVPHQGCPHRCLFCDQKAVSGALAAPDPADVRSTVERYLSSTGLPPECIEIAFFGGSFTAIPREIQRRLLSAASDYARSGRIGGIRVSTRPDAIDTSALALLREFGVTAVELGAQSFQDDVLLKACRGHTADQTMRSAELIRYEGFSLVIQLLPGLPGETGENALNSARTAISLAPDAVRIYPAVVLQGTGLELLYRDGSYAPLSIEEAVELCADIRSLFDDAGIPVIRTGLHPLSGEHLSRIIAGPYHPGLGFLVKSRLKRRSMERELHAWFKAGGASKRVHFLIPLKNKEEYIGLKRENVAYLKKMHFLESIQSEISDIDEFKVRPQTP